VSKRISRKKHKNLRPWPRPNINPDSRNTHNHRDWTWLRHFARMLIS